jgi:hypothetical protein
MNPSTHPPANELFGFAYDTESDRAILFGGTHGGAANETWAYDYNNNTWTNMNPEIHPPARQATSMAYDETSDKIILFGGQTIDASNLNDTWTYNYNDNTWQNITADTHPLGRAGHRMTYDTESDRIILFGGSDEDPKYKDTWAYNYPATQPSPIDLIPIILIVGGASAVIIFVAVVYLKRPTSNSIHG